MLSVISIASGLILSAGCATCGRRFLNACEREAYERAFWLKGTAGLCFLALGILSAGIGHDPDFAWRICLGLLFGLMGDELLAMRFIRRDKHDFFFSIGAGSFAIGHVLYIWALMKLSGARPVEALPVTALGAMLSAVYARIRKTDAGKLTPCAALYIVLVVFMAATACTAAVRSFSIGALMFAVAGICFAVSDNILCAYCYGNKKTPVMNSLVHITYYTAQLLIAWSIAFV